MPVNGLLPSDEGSRPSERSSSVNLVARVERTGRETGWEGSTPRLAAPAEVSISSRTKLDVACSSSSIDSRSDSSGTVAVVAGEDAGSGDAAGVGEREAKPSRSAVLLRWMSAIELIDGGELLLWLDVGAKADEAVECRTAWWET